MSAPFFSFITDCPFEEAVEYIKSYLDCCFYRPAPPDYNIYDALFARKDVVAIMNHKISKDKTLYSFHNVFTNNEVEALLDRYGF